MENESLGSLIGRLANRHSAFTPSEKAEAAFRLVEKVHALEAENRRLKAENHSRAKVSTPSAEREDEMQRLYCEQSESDDIEEYCRACGQWPVCFDCLTDEWCPDCSNPQNNTPPTREETP